MIKTHNSCRVSRFIDSKWFPAGVDEGLAKSLLYNKLARASAHKAAPDHDDPRIQRIANMARKIEAYEARSKSLSGRFAKVKGVLHKGASIVSESSIVLAAAFGGALAGSAFGYGAAGGVVGASVATFPHSYGASLVRDFKAEGYDLTNPGQVSAALSNKRVMSQAKGSALSYASQAAAIVAAAGTVAGFAHKAAAKTVAGATASLARSFIPKIAAELAGELAATGLKSTVNSAVRGALGSNATRRAAISMAGAAAMMVSPDVSQINAQRDVARDHVEYYQTPQTYNTSSLYL